eukprot:2142770-Rhodomonas_salina.1
MSRSIDRFLSALFLPLRVQPGLSPECAVRLALSSRRPRSCTTRSRRWSALSLLITAQLEGEGKGKTERGREEKGWRRGGEGRRRR